MKTYQKYFSIGLTVSATILHILLQLALTGGLRDSIFDSLLLVATLFLITKMDKLCFEFTNTSDDFYINLYKNSNENALEKRDEDIKKIFYNKNLKFCGLAYGLLVSSAVFFINKNILPQPVNLCLCSYLFLMNYFTGVAVAKLFHYFRTSKQWMDHISFSVPSYDNNEIAYIRKIRNKVLFIAIIYCFFSQISIIFSSIHINSLIYLYAGFSVILVLSIVFYSETQISSLRKKSFNMYMDIFNSKISEFYNFIFQTKSLSITTDDMDKIHALIELKDNFTANYNRKFDFNVFLSSLGLVLTAILPVLLQYLFDKML